MTESKPAGEQFVQSLARGLAVIRAFDADNPRMTLSEVAQRTDLSRATARRFLLTLSDLGYVRTDGRMFELTPAVLALGYSYLSSLSLPQLAQPHLELLSRQVGESTSASVLDGGDIVYVCRVPAKRIMSVAITVGTRFPAYATSMGRVLLAGLPAQALRHYLDGVTMVPLTETALSSVAELAGELEQVRRQGWAVVDQELEAGLLSVAAPVRDAAGTVVAAINVSMRARYGDEGDHMDSIRSHLLAAVAAISADVAARGGR
ncbi:IclR family transcriptional regulator domain-containing protein [Specibacter sp. RAF43]|uniref:IclR family transcriptional regulator domain-containing protein n=1 Tax=Specibacter sp. RAF43 TaxID=3233057 RepID=UPI003F9C37D3